MDSLQIVMFTTAWCLGGLVNGLTGMGASMVALPLFSWFMPMETAVPVGCLIGGLLSMEMAVRYRAHLRFKLLVPMLLAGVPGVFVGAQLLRVVPGNVLRCALAVLLLAHLFRSSRRRAPHAETSSTTRQLPRWAAPLAGFGSGLCNAAISYAAPPMAMYAESAGWDQRTAKALLSTYFSILTFFTVTVQALDGLYTPAVGNAVLLALPSALAGVLLSLPLARALAETGYHRLIRVFIAAAAVLLLVKTFFGS